MKASSRLKEAKSQMAARFLFEKDSRTMTIMASQRKMTPQLTMDAEREGV